VLLDDPVVEPKNIGFMVTSPIPNQWIRVLGSLSGTPNYDWLLREVFNCQEYSDINDLYDEIGEAVLGVPPGANKVLYLPFIHGERSPFVNPHATACFVGIREKTTRIDMARAIFEGVALAARHNLDSIGKTIEEIVVTGGGSSNCGWCQIFADVTRANIRVPAKKELGTLGAAIIAAKGLGTIDDFSFTSDNESEDLVYFPDESNEDFYAGLYDLYIRTIEGMQDYYRQRHELFK
jgi:sugar (pentulose or hexulose) kinase